MKKSRFFVVFYLITIVQSVVCKSQSSLCPEYITIYVHGTTTKLGLRLLSHFFKDLAFGAPGINHIDELPKTSLLRQDMLHLQAQNPSRFDLNHFYTFGWSGSLSFKERDKAGLQLYEDLIKLLSEYRIKYGKIPKVQIWTMSHGGNVALNMVKHLPFFASLPVHLDLILVAVPVQKVTEKLIESPYIAKSYVISSTGDLMQIVDRYKFGKKRYWPTRFFDTKVPNCYQVKVLINDRGIAHTDLLRSFTVHMPYVLQYADLQQKTIFGNEQSSVCTCSILDPHFRFYKFFNLKQVVYGKPKTIKKSKK